MTFTLGNKNVNSVEVKQINFKPGQKSGAHLHPCPVTGYITKGTVTFQINGGQENIIQSGEVFYEPAGATILKFDNNSETEPMSFIAFYLLDNNHELIKML